METTATIAGNGHIAFIDGRAVREILPPSAAVDALEAVLSAGLDPERDSPRSRVDTGVGQFLQMPSAWQDSVGTKLLTITPANPALGAPVIQGLYVLFGGETRQPQAVLDGMELTNLRTSAVSALGARLLAAPGPQRLVVFGTGVQAWEHLKTFNDVFELEDVAIVGRRPAAAAALAARASAELGLAARAADASAVAAADLVICCTAADQPLFDGTLVSDSAVVVAMGAHEPTSRELDDALMGRAAVVVESVDSALREAGDVIQALSSGALTGPGELITLAELVTGKRPIPRGRPVVFKTTGMPWQDLALARAIVDAHPAVGGPGPGTSR
ncbi:ornithine cyclodeaminase family protein [Crystallibacter degradans]|uniref:ornithine cyclodeaminase family protein n=1 Tax=Crystallibacter degradans TaxID=2726743 RepID=UPI001474932C|nr:ornithine cyclodeaminase family protein [Arthrobacter sp. SF27]NMR29132.1 ornithine cyclodeaminase family protein [Arthrobacter sp. SF27]